MEFQSFYHSFVRFRLDTQFFSKKNPRKPFDLRGNRKVMFAPSAQVMILPQDDFAASGKSDDAPAVTVMRCVPLSTREAHITCEAYITPEGTSRSAGAEHIVAKSALCQQTKGAFCMARCTKKDIWLSAFVSRCFVGAALIRPKADEPPGLRSKQSPGGRSSPLSCLGTLRIFRTALISEACWICLRQIAFVPNAGLLTLTGKSSPYGVFAELNR